MRAANASQLLSVAGGPALLRTLNQTGVPRSLRLLQGAGADATCAAGVLQDAVMIQPHRAHLSPPIPAKLLHVHSSGGGYVRRRGRPPAKLFHIDTISGLAHTAAAVERFFWRSPRYAKSSGRAQKTPASGREGPMTPVRHLLSGKLRTSATLPQVLDRRLLLYTLAAGTALAAVPASHAEVVFTPSSVVFRGLGKFDIDLDNDGTADFSLLIRWIHYDTGTLIPALFAYGDRPSHQIVANRVDALPLKKNTRIGAGQRFRALGVMESSNVYGSNWQNVKGRCLGVRFLINGEVHYGWIGFREVRVFPIAAKLYGWAYETVPDKEILAGDTGTATPLDSSISPTSLEILAAGHTAIEQRRKRTALVPPGM